MGDAMSLDSEAVLVHVEEALRTAGYTAESLRVPGSSFNGVVASIDLGSGRVREALAILEDGNVGIYLTTPHELPARMSADLTLPNAHRITCYNARPDIGEAVVGAIRLRVKLGMSDDPKASPENLRTAIETIASYERNGTGSMGNARGPDIASLAKITLQLLERVEVLEKRLS